MATKVLPHTRLVRLLNLIEKLKTKRLNVKEIAYEYNVNIRTAYRYIDILEASNIPVETDFNHKFFIQQ